MPVKQTVTWLSLAMFVALSSARIASHAESPAIAEPALQTRIYDIRAVPVNDCAEVLHSIDTKVATIFLAGHRVTPREGVNPCTTGQNTFVVITPKSACTSAELAQCQHLPGRT